VLPQIDALRGIAILAVFVQHLGDRFRPFVEERVAARTPAELAPWILTVLHHAFWGVDLFFVLSGFSLSLGLIQSLSPDRDERRGRLEVRSFYLRRAARILPAFFVAIGVMIAVHPLVVRLPGFAGAVATHLVLLQGYVLPGGIVFIGAAWSLTTEAHFYLLLPLLARPLLRRDPRAPLRRFAFGFALCALVWGARALLHAWVLEPGVHSPILEATQRRWIVSRLDQFVLGALAAAAYTEVARVPHARRAAARAAPLAFGLSIAALPIAFKLEGASYLSPGGSFPYALISLATAALVLSAALCEGGARRLLAPAPLRAIGIISYGVFLYHQLAIGLVGSWLGANESLSWASLGWNGALALALASSMGLASWIAIERPILRWAAARTRRGP
jgi:peptidoglycan/LPS O-acetylase OafA/YrhL